MSESGTSAAPDGVSSTGTITPRGTSATPGIAAPGAAAAPEGEGHAPVGTAVLTVLALTWLAATLWSTHPAFASVPGGGRLGLLAATLELPGLLAAVLAAGAGAAVLARALVVYRSARPARPARTRPSGTARSRSARTTQPEPDHSGWRGTGASGYAVGAAAGLGAGLVAALVVGSAGLGTPMVVLLTAVLVAGVAGGLAAGVQSRAVVAAGLAGTLAGFGTDFAMRLVQNAAGARLATLGAGAGWLSALLVGLAAGLAAYLYLRRLAGTARWPQVMLAGAGYGLIELAATLGARAVAGQAFGLGAVVGLSAINYALVVAFAGALTAMLAHGRGLPAADRTG